MLRAHRSGTRLLVSSLVSHGVKATAVWVLWASLCGAPSTADESATLPLVEADAWSRLERALACERAGLWAEAIDEYRAMLADARAAGGEKQYLLLDPPPPQRNLAQMMDGYLKLVPVLVTAKVDLVDAFTVRDTAKQLEVSRANDDACRRFLVHLGVDPAGPELRAAAQAFLASQTGRAEAERFTPAEAAEAVEKQRAEALLRERFGLDTTLLDACAVARAYAADGKTGLLRALHDPSVHVGVETYVAGRLGSLPAAGRAVYYESMGAPARAKLAAAGNDRRRLAELVRDHPALPETARALDRLALIELEAGDAVAAIDHWRRLSRETPYQEALGPAALATRLAMAHAELGEVEAVDNLVEDHARDAGVVLRLGTQSRTLGEHLTAMRALASERAGQRLPAYGTPGEQAWAIDYRREFARDRAGEKYPVEQLPVVDEAAGLLYLRTQAEIKCYELATGKLRAMAAPALVSEPRQRGRSTPRVGEAAVASEGFHALCVGGRYLVAMTDLRGRDVDDTEPGLPTTTLLCHDRELALSWRRPRADAEEDGLLTRGLVGSVLATDGATVYAGVTVFSGDITSHVYAFDIATGATRWRRFLCGRPQTSVQRFPEATVSCGGGTVYVATGMGCAAAIDAATGVVRWLSRYPSLPEEGRYRRVSPAHENRWCLQAPLVLGGRVAIAPTDAPELYILDAASGHEINHYPGGDNPNLRYCLGLDENGMLVLGGRRVHAICDRGVVVGQDPRRVRLAASASLVYDDNDPEHQLSRWHVEGATAEAVLDGVLFASLVHNAGRTTVSLYRSERATDADLIATGSISGRSGQAELGPPKGARDEAHAPIYATVQVDFKRAAQGNTMVRVYVPAELIARPVVARGQVLVPTALGVLRLAASLDATAFWGKQVLEDYDRGNLSIARSTGGALLIVAGRQRCVAYRERRP